MAVFTSSADISVGSQNHEENHGGGAFMPPHFGFSLHPCVQNIPEIYKVTDRERCHMLRQRSPKAHYQSKQPACCGLQCFKYGCCFEIRRIEV